MTASPMLLLTLLAVMTLSLGAVFFAHACEDCQDHAALAAEPAEQTEQQTPAALNFTMKSLDGEDVDLARYHGKVVMMVNVASRCGHTPQYKALQALHEKYAQRGLAILGFPCNQFGNQEPGTAEQIAEFCEENYGVTFDMFDKIEVNGDNAAPLYAYLTSEDTGLENHGPVRWNFEKFLLDRDGKVIARFGTRVQPDSEAVIHAIEAALGPAEDQ